MDKDAAWLKKGGEFRYGYKKHHVTDEEGLVLGVVTTKATTNEIANLEQVLDAANLPRRIAVKADKGYQSQKNADLLKKKKLKNHILKKAKKNRALTEREKKFNKPIGQTRFKVERTFGGIKRWFNGGVARCRGIKSAHSKFIGGIVLQSLSKSQDNCVQL